jgi:hypothetical protein
MVRASESRCAMNMTVSSASFEEVPIKYVCGIDIGSQSCAGCICRPDKSVVIKSITIALAREGWQIWEEKLDQLDAPSNQILIGMEATSRDARESLSRVGAAWLSAASLTPRTNPSFSPTTRLTGQD